MKCLLDMDGVVADFVRAAMRLHDKPWPYGEGAAGDDYWDIIGLWSMTPEEFWAPLGRDFWSSVPKTPDADEVVNTVADVVGRENICFLTSPCGTDGCVDGKREWLAEHYPDIPTLFSVSSRTGGLPPKQFCAGPGTILIDDHTPSVQKFREFGGFAFLYPRPWNNGHAFQGQALPMLRESLTLWANSSIGSTSLVTDREIANMYATET